MSISPRDVWPSLPADRRSVILDDLAALLREISHDLGPHHATAPVPQSGDLHSRYHVATATTALFRGVGSSGYHPEP